MNIEQLAREAGFPKEVAKLEPHAERLQRFHTLSIAEEHKRLLEGSGGHAAYRQWNSEEGYWYYGAPDCAEKDDELLYTADQMAAAVLLERERCAAICDVEAERGADVYNWSRSYAAEDIAAAIRNTK